ncbi:peptidyl-prolyl cis-trans isomerase FKBP62-like isoform X2 [Salvia splendens]|uniref:peptidyl-prolyl cis-trans isomerase FKBP62-like isoform X2 n=1 Tax=Salvia splendens TaxID=180675 RepID=UPI001C269932|nr:peptidyl-prolyl cis-trans isomerase FKBP62-like isoform X2 [Salvia splendens]
MVQFSKVNIKDFVEADDDEEEPGEEVESAPPLKVGEEREIGSKGLRKRLVKSGVGWETPQFGDEVTIHYVGTLCEDGSIFASTRTKNEPVTLKLGHGNIVGGLDHGIITMKRGEIASFMLQPELAYGVSGTTGVPSNSIVQFEVELLSWITVVDICKDGGIIKKILESGEQIGPPGDLDEVCVSYKAMLGDGTIVAETPEEGMEFYVEDGHFCPALTKALKTMKRGERVSLVVQPQYAFGQKGHSSNNELPVIPPDSILSIFVKLLSLKPVIDVTGDLKVKKKVLKEGEGTVTANDGATVTIRYTAMLEDGTVFERKGFGDEQPLQFITDEEQVIAGLDRAVSTMKKHELSLITISPEYGFGNTEVKMEFSLVQPSSTILYEVEMLDFIREKAPWEMSTPERIEAATRKKEEGNQLFKIGKYQRAAKKYEKAVDYVSQDEPYTDGDEKIIKPLTISCWSNGAACCLKLNNFREAIDLCSKILNEESCNVKALYRRAQAYMGIAELLLAELDIKKALEVDPQNREMKLMQMNLKQLQAEKNKQDATLYRAMFSSKSEDACIAEKRLKISNDEEDTSMLDESTAGMIVETDKYSC